MGIVKRKITFFLFAKVAANNYMTGNIFKFNKIALSLQRKKPLNIQGKDSTFMILFRYHI